MRAEFTGRIIEIGEVRKGEGKNGPWKSARVVAEEIYGSYINKVVFDAMNENLDNSIKAQKQGTYVKIECSVRGRQSQKGDWFNDVRMNSIVPAGQSQQMSPSTPMPASELEPKDDDLPWD